MTFSYIKKGRAITLLRHMAVKLFEEENKVDTVILRTAGYYCMMLYYYTVFQELWKLDFFLLTK